MALSPGCFESVLVEQRRLHLIRVFSKMMQAAARMHDELHDAIRVRGESPVGQHIRNLPDLIDRLATLEKKVR